MIDDARAFETGRVLGVIAIGVDGGRNRSANFFRPDIVVIRTMTGRRVDKTCTRVIGDVITVKKRNVKIVTLFAQRMVTNKLCEFIRINKREFTIAVSNSCFFHYLISKIVSNYVLSLQTRAQLSGSAETIS